MLEPGSPFTVALFATAQEDHDLVAALLSQYQRSRFHVEVFTTAAAARAAIAERRHDAYVADAAMLDQDRGKAEALPREDTGPVPEAGEAALFGLAVSSGPRDETLGGARVFVLPNPSGRNANYSYAEMLDAFTALRRWLSDSTSRSTRL